MPFHTAVHTIVVCVVVTFGLSYGGWAATIGVWRIVTVDLIATSMSGTFGSRLQVLRQNTSEHHAVTDRRTSQSAHSKERRDPPIVSIGRSASGWDAPFGTAIYRNHYDDGRATCGISTR